MRRFPSEVRRALGRWIRPSGRVHLSLRFDGQVWQASLGAALYLFTFALASIAALARFAIGWVLVVGLGLLCVAAASVGLFGLGGFFAWVGGTLPSPVVCGWFVATVPLAFSLAALVVPGRETFWRRWVGARPASAGEIELVAPIVAAFKSLDRRCGGRFRCYVVDSPAPFAFVRGRVLVVSTGLLDCVGLAGVLAHEFGHLVSWDGRLTAALDRLGLWGDVLGLSGGAEFGDDGWGVAVVWGVVRALVWLAGASWCLRVMRAPLAAFWRSRERAADAFAVELRQGEVLADHLEMVEKPRERLRRYRFLDRREHDPVALRVERLRALVREGK